MQKKDIEKAFAQHEFIKSMLRSQSDTSRLAGKLRHCAMGIETDRYDISNYPLLGVQITNAISQGWTMDEINFNIRIGFQTGKVIRQASKM